MGLFKKKNNPFYLSTEEGIVFWGGESIIKS